LGASPPACNWFETLLGIEEGGPARERMRTLRVATIMTPNPVFVDEDATVDDVVTEMDRRQVGQVPAVCADRVIGIVSRLELIAALELRLSRKEKAEAGSGHAGDRFGGNPDAAPAAGMEASVPG
jgi:predicted transcriptional regulator